MTASHVIETLTHACGFQSEALAWDQQSRLEHFAQHHALQTLQVVFDRFGAPGEVWRLETLDVDLGVLDAGDTDAMWAARLEECLTEALERLWPYTDLPEKGEPSREERVDLASGTRTPSLAHEVVAFVAFLEKGYLPWHAFHATRREVGAWLQTLLEHAGSELWLALQAVGPWEEALERLGGVASPDALHTLLRQRHAGLARSVELLERQTLLSLQASGRLSPYQTRQLQRQWRVAALKALWGYHADVIQPDRLAALQYALNASLSRALGQEIWTLALPVEELVHAAETDQAVAPLLLELLQGLLAPPGTAPSLALLEHLNVHPWGSEKRVSPQMWWLFHRALLTASPLDAPTFQALLQETRALSPLWLQHTLRLWSLRRALRRTWCAQLDTDCVGMLWNALDPSRQENPLHAQAALTLAEEGAGLDEALRQFLLGLVHLPSGVDAPTLRLWLLEGTFRHVLQGGHLPQDHVAWQQFWQTLVMELSGPTLAEACPPEEPETTRDALLRHLRQGGGAASRIKLWDLMASPDAQEAWLSETSEPERWDLLRVLLPEHEETLRACSEGLRHMATDLFPTYPRATLDREHWRFLARHVFEEGLEPSPGLLVRRFAQHLARFEPPGPSKPLPVLRGLFRKLSDKLQEVASPLFRKMAFALGEGPTASEAWEAAHPRGAALPTPALAWPLSQGALGQEDDPVYVGNAGLILLAPYLERLFAMLELTRHKAFVHDQARARAILCMEYLVHGHNESQEPAWPLDKLLCGLPFTRAIPPCEGLDDSTREQLEELLRAVIKHWKVLGKTSVAGLRESFLCREGRLTPAAEELGGGWRLQVEPRPFDMLLDHLPWGFSVIKLPWMEGALHVAWR